MSKVIAGFSMSLDGFVSDADDGVDEVFKWYSAGVADTEVHTRGRRRIAGDDNVVIGAPSVTQQCLQLGLLDEIHIDLAPVLLGKGIRLFDHLDSGPVELAVVEASVTPYVTHLPYRVRQVGAGSHRPLTPLDNR